MVWAPARHAILAGRPVFFQFRRRRKRPRPKASRPNKSGRPVGQAGIVDRSPYQFFFKFLVHLISHFIYSLDRFLIQNE